MDCSKVGNLISRLRKEKGMTQKEVADAINISDKTVSKWERGLGCPDVSLLSELSKVLRVDIEKILSGEISQNDKIVGNMKRIKFYVCPICGNIITSTGSASISCCGRKIEELYARKSEAEHKMKIELMDDENFISLKHVMEKNHFISFIAYATMDRVLLTKLYSEQNAEEFFPKMRGGKFYFYCTKDGLFEQI